MANGIEIRFDGKRYGFWQKVDIHEAVDDLSASVNLSVMSLKQGAGILPLSENTIIEVLVADKLATTVRVDTIRRRVDANSHSITIEGRSLGREFVDCQYSVTLSNLKLEEIVSRLCSTFKVPLNVLTKTELVPDFSMQCEQPANALINAVRAANLLLYPTVNGGLVLTEPTNAAPVTSLIYGQHILSYDLVDEYKLRFSDYLVKGYDHESAASTHGSVKDGDFHYFRPMYIMADKMGQGIGGCGRRAELEMNRRKARAHRIDLTVKGWEHPSGLWAINTQVRVVIPPEGIDAVFLIGERTLTLDDRGGSITHLQVMSREAFIGEKVKKSRATHGITKKKPKRHTPVAVIDPLE